MPAFLRRFILFQLALIVIPLAFMNRHDVAVYFDPWALDDESAALHIPLFLLILFCLGLGLLFGFTAGRVYNWWRRRYP